MNPILTMFSVLAGVAVGILLLRMLYRKSVTKRTSRLLGQAIACSVVVCVTAAESCFFQRPLSIWELLIVVLGVLAVIDALWKRRTASDTPA